MNQSLVSRISTTFFFLFLLNLIWVRLSSATCSPALSELNEQSGDSVDHVRSVELESSSLEDIAAHLQRGSFTSVDLVHAYIERIRELNHIVRAVSEVNPDAIDIATALDRERSRGRVRGPLHGIPVIVKDNIATNDKLNNTAGSYALLGARVKRESLVIIKLRDAGAIILGKATMGEWAQYRSRWNVSSHGWSPYGGQPLGAYHSQQDPHGSSSGSATAIAVGLATIALGTETSGSIVNPSEKGNLVGIKPTVGLTTRDMVIPISTRQDSVGPMARTVRDAAILLTAIAGKDKHDNYTFPQPHVVPDYSKACDSATFNGARIGIPWNGIVPFLSEDTSPIMDAFNKAIVSIGQAGATIMDPANFSSFDLADFSGSQDIVLDTDFASNMRLYLSKLTRNPNRIRDVQDMADFVARDTREAHGDRGIHVWESVLSRNVTDTSYESWEAYQTNIRLATDEGVTGVLDKYDLDALMMPTFTAFHLPAIGGLPIVTVPLGFLPPSTPVRMNALGTMVQMGPGIPFGISFIGRAWSEEKLISLAYAFEQMTMVRKQSKPIISPSTTVNIDAGKKPGVVICAIVGNEFGANDTSEAVSAGWWTTLTMRLLAALPTVST